MEKALSMKTPVTQEDFATLLEHSAWVRRLAGRLLRDDALADDLTQEALLTALVTPPTKGLPVGPWLGKVVRNLVRMRVRSTRRRQDRETAVAGRQDHHHDCPNSPEALAAQIEAQRTLTSLVGSLEEPFRATILLRYYDGLSAAEIAARQGVPAGTVRWRLKAGLDKLRTALKRTHGEDRRTWLPAICLMDLEPTRRGGVTGVSLGTNLQRAVSLNGWIPMVVLTSAVVTGLWVTSGKGNASPDARTASSPSTVAAIRNTAPVLPRLDKQQRTQLLHRIGQAQEHATSLLRDRRPSLAGTATFNLDEDYIRKQMAILLPLIKQCYETALSERPRLSGMLVVGFTIVGEPDVGGLVVDSTVDTTTSTITDQGMRECVQETMYGAQFPAPLNGGEVHVTYPFSFASDQ